MKKSSSANTSSSSNTSSSTNSNKSTGRAAAIASTDVSPIDVSPIDVTPIDATVRTSVRQYLAEIDGELPTDFYQLVLSQVEAPLLEEVMRHTRNNQTRAAYLLGLNRGTLRKKLRLYKLSGEP